MTTNVQEMYTQRLTGILSPSFRKRRIGQIGAGAGSYIAEKVARLCPTEVRLCDFDEVSVSNLSRTAYRFDDAANERLKVYALQQRLADVNPLVSCTAFPWDITAVSDADREEFFDGLDLVIAGTDRLQAQALINEWTFGLGIPAVFIGFHAGAAGGRIIWTLRGETPCYRCVARERFEAAERRSEPTDLVGANGCLIDAQLIDMIAVRIGLALLERGQDSRMGRFFTALDGRNEVVVRCDPEYRWGQELWAALLEDLPKGSRDYGAELRDVMLCADTLWLRTKYDPACPVCGGGDL